MAAAKVTTINIDGRDVDINVRANGQFFGDGPEGEISGPTLSVVEKQLRLRWKKGRQVAVELTTIEEGWGRHEDTLEVLDVAVVGRHAGNRNFMVRLPNGKTEQSRGYGFFQRFTPADHSKARELYAARNAATKAWEDFKTERAANVARLLDEAIAAADAAAGAGK